MSAAGAPPLRPADGPPLDAGHWLATMLRTEPPHLPPRLDSRDLLPALAHHRVRATLRDALRAIPDPPAGLPEAQRGWRLHQVARDLAMRRDLELLGETLGVLGAGWAVVKGPALAVLAYGGWQNRDFTDLDVLVHGGDLDAVISALQSSGAQLVDQNWPLIRRRMQGELTVQLPHGTTLDLHWHLLNSPERRQAFPLDMSALLRRVEVASSAPHLPVLSREDQLVHLALHACHGGGDRLLWLKDLQMVASLGVDWDTVLARSATAHADLALGLMLERTVRIIGADVPEEVQRRLGAGRPWRALCAWTQRRWPVETAHDGGRSGRPLVMSVRRGTLDSAGALLGRRRRRRGMTSESAGFGHPPGTNPLHVAVPDAVARAEFLRLVVSTP